MKITIEACGMACDLSISSHELGIQLIVSHDGLANRKIIPYTQLEDGASADIHREIYNGVKRLERDIKTYRRHS